MSGAAALEQATALVNVLESVTTVAAVATRTARQQLQRQEKVADAVPDINWSQVSGMFQPLEICMEKCVIRFNQEYFVQVSFIDLPQIDRLIDR